MDIANRQEISEKYLEAIVSKLSKNGFLISMRGKGGGYKLARLPELYTIYSILEITEGTLAPVACLDNKPNQCQKVLECKTIKMWEGLNQLIHDYFNGITLADLLEIDPADNYII